MKLQTQITADKDVEITSLNNVVADANQTIGSKNTQLAAANAACKADIKVAVDNEKKNRKWYAVAGAAAFAILQYAIIK